MPASKANKQTHLSLTVYSPRWAGAVGKANRLLEQPDDFGEQNI